MKYYRYIKIRGADKTIVIQNQGKWYYHYLPTINYNVIGNCPKFCPQYKETLMLHLLHNPNLQTRLLDYGYYICRCYTKG